MALWAVVASASDPFQRRAFPVIVSIASQNCGVFVNAPVEVYVLGKHRRRDVREDELSFAEVHSLPRSLSLEGAGRDAQLSEAPSIDNPQSRSFRATWTQEELLLTM